MKGDGGRGETPVAYKRLKVGHNKSFSTFVAKALALTTWQHLAPAASVAPRWTFTVNTRGSPPSPPPVPPVPRLVRLGRCRRLARCTDMTHFHPHPHHRLRPHPV